MPGTPAPSGAKFASEAAGGGLSDCVPAALVFSRELAIGARPRWRRCCAGQSRRCATKYSIREMQMLSPH